MNFNGIFDGIFDGIVWGFKCFLFLIECLILMRCYGGFMGFLMRLNGVCFGILLESWWISWELEDSHRLLHDDGNSPWNK
jgi:hypothetical protein